MTADLSRKEIADRLIEALRGGHFVLYGQAISPLRREHSPRPFREILIRFLEEEQKLLPPGEFFPILADQGLIGLLDRWVVNEILRISPVSGAGRPRNSVNLSSDSIVDAEFAHFVSSRIKHFRAEQDVLCFEVAQSEALAHLSHLRQLAMSLKPAGCSFALGGYTGANANVDLLRELPIRYLKLDSGLVRRLLVSRDINDLVKATVERCRGMKVETIAELVEDPHTLATLTDLGVDHAQGYQISKPAPIPVK